MSNIHPPVLTDYPSLYKGINKIQFITCTCLSWVVSWTISVRCSTLTKDKQVYYIILSHKLNTNKSCTIIAIIKSKRFASILFWCSWISLLVTESIWRTVLKNVTVRQSGFQQAKLINLSETSIWGSPKVHTATAVLLLFFPSLLYVDKHSHE